MYKWILRTTRLELEVGELCVYIVYVYQTFNKKSELLLQQSDWMFWYLIWYWIWLEEIFFNSI